MGDNAGKAQEVSREDWNDGVQIFLWVGIKNNENK